MSSNSIFKVDAATHALTQIASFPGNHSVQLALSTGPRGTIYGSTEHEIFKIDGATHKVSQLARIEELAPKEQSATFSTIYLLSDGNLYGVTGLRLFRVPSAVGMAKTTEDARPADSREALAQAIAK